MEIKMSFGWTLWILILGCNINVCRSQNLVLNPSFEARIEDPSGCCSQIDLCLYWNKEGHAYLPIKRAEYFVQGYVKKRLQKRMKVPTPLSGEAMAGFSPSFYQLERNKGSKLGEKLQGELDTPLIAGQLYCMTFYFYYSVQSFFPVEELGVLFYSDFEASISTDSDGVNIMYKPQVVFQDSVLGVSGSWNCVNLTYKAIGGESGFILGSSIRMEYNQDEVPMTGRKIRSGKHRGERFWSFNYDYYFIDDVAVFPVSNAGMCGCKDE